MARGGSKGGEASGDEWAEVDLVSIFPQKERKRRKKVEKREEKVEEEERG